MKAYVAVTDYDWYSFLSKRPDLDEVNFWQPGGKHHFRALEAGELFLFKLHSPQNYIVGGGFFAHSTILPMSLAWEAFGEKNGAASFEEKKRRIEKYRRIQPSEEIDYHVGCILLEQPFFLPERDWIPVPSDWKRSIVQGKTYELTAGHGKDLWDLLVKRLSNCFLEGARSVETHRGRYGAPVPVFPRLGQGSFRVMITDAYERRCAITNERTLPTLEAAHIKPYSISPNTLENGILLRSDIHKLFDRGYVTVTPDHHFKVSKRIREEFSNGRDYYALDSKEIYVPVNKFARPSSDFLIWHNENVYRN